MSNEIMIDIETFDTTNEAVVFQIAAVVFDSKTHETIKSFTTNLDIDDQLKKGRTISSSTVAFHLGIPSNAKKSLEDIERREMKWALVYLNRHIGEYKPRAIWSKGAFDFNILESMYKMVNMEAPWRFYQLRELRTLMKECGVGKGDVAHTAHDDCLAQIKQLAACREKIHGPTGR